MRAPGRRPLILLVIVVLALVAPGTSAATQENAIVALGDSLTAGWGVAPDEAYPSLLEARLRQEGFAYHVINAGVSGDTTAGGRRRVDWVLRSRPQVVIVALGANDGLRGQPVVEMQTNLIAIIDRLRGAGAKVLLAGMRLPPNYGAYAQEFAAAFPVVARRATAFAPFLLDGVAADPHLNQADGIHPNAAGHRVIAERLWPYLRPLLRLDGRTSAANRLAGVPGTPSW
jgi:acyl-CoA thioesterase I